MPVGCAFQSGIGAPVRGFAASQPRGQSSLTGLLRMRPHGSAISPNSLQKSALELSTSTDRPGWAALRSGHAGTARRVRAPRRQGDLRGTKASPCDLMIPNFLAVGQAVPGGCGPGPFPVSMLGKCAGRGSWPSSDDPSPSSKQEAAPAAMRLKGRPPCDQRPACAWSRGSAYPMRPINSIAATRSFSA